MLSHRNRARLLGAIGVCLFTCSVISRGRVNDATTPDQAWRDFGALLLYQWGTGLYPSVEWLNLEINVPDPDSRQAVTAAQTVLSQAFNGYGAHALAVQGRIPLDRNPRCLLGLYLAERFSGTRLGNWGGRQFDACIEQACRVALRTAGDAWRARLSAELSAPGESRSGPAATGVWGGTEVPYLYLYLLRNAPTADVRNDMRERLARRLWQRYGVEPGLRQYLILLDEGGTVDGTWLEVAAQLEQTGARGQAERVYEQILRNTDSLTDAGKAYESLARLLLRESRQQEAVRAWSLLSQKFPQAECTDPALKSFLNDFQLTRAQTGRRLWGELARIASGPQALQWCRYFAALWPPEEAPAQWQAAAETAEPGSLAQQLGHVFRAGALLDIGQTDAAEALIREYILSPNPFVRARSLAVSGEIAQRRNDVEESARQYAKAVQIDRQTSLPSWYKELFPVPPAGAQTPAAEQPALRLFLKGCNLLIEGDYAGAVDSLHQAARDSPRLPTLQRQALPCVMMLASMGIEDYAQAEAWGYKTLKARCADRPGDAQMQEYLDRIQNIDATLSQLATALRNPVMDATAVAAALWDVMDLCAADTNPALFESRTEAMDRGVLQLYARAQRRHLTGVLTAEYLVARQHEAPGGPAECSSSLLPVFFVAQVLSEDPFDQIRERLLSLGEAQDALSQLYRFAVFARNLNRMDLARSALDAAAAAPVSAVDVEVLEGMAGIYLSASHHQKAIEIYEKLSTLATDPGRARAALLRIADLYAEDLKNYDKAVQKYEEFVQKYPDSPEAGQVEFLLGKCAYLRKDYAGAVGQLDGFQKKYPAHPQVGAAMMLAALSRMAEGNTGEAVGRFQEIIRRYPDSDMAARSKFLTGYAQVSAQQYAAARETFRQLIEQFPQSPYVKQAQELLDRLGRVSP